MRAICIQDAQQIWLAFDNGISQITFDPSITLLGKRSQIGKLKNATLFNDTLYIQTNIGYFKRTLDAGDHFEPVDIKKATFHLLPQNSVYDSLRVSNVFYDTESLGEFAHAEQIYPIGDNT